MTPYSSSIRPFFGQGLHGVLAAVRPDGIVGRHLRMTLDGEEIANERHAHFESN